MMSVSAKDGSEGKNLGEAELDIKGFLGAVADDAAGTYVKAKAYFSSAWYDSDRKKPKPNAEVFIVKEGEWDGSEYRLTRVGEEDKEKFLPGASWE